MGETQHRKVVPYFIVGIGVPAVILASLALRGVSNDQALAERARRESFRVAADGVVRALRDSLQEFGRVLESLMPAERHRFDSSAGALPRMGVEGFFSSGNSNLITYPRGQLLFAADGENTLPAAPAQPESVRKAIALSEQYEFQTGELSRALEVYREVMRRPGTSLCQGQLLNAVARLQKKLGWLADARATYMRIAEMADEQRTPGGTPLGLLARHEAGRLHLTSGDTTAAIAELMSVYQDLQSSRWHLEKSQYIFYRSSLTALLDPLVAAESSSRDEFSLAGRYFRLRERATLQQQTSERLLLLQSRGASLFRSYLGDTSHSVLAAPVACSLEADGEMYLLLLWRRPAGWFAGAVLDARSLVVATLTEMMRSPVIGPQTSWQVLGGRGEVLAMSRPYISGLLAAKVGFPDGFPPWSIEIYQEEQQFLEALFSEDQRTNLVMFALVVIILVFGLVTTIRSVNRELDLARLKSDFISTVSHEFKSPLTAIRQLGEMLQAGRIPSEERRQQYYDVIVEESERISLLVENLLDLARLEDAKRILKFESADVTLLLREVVEQFRCQSLHAGFEVCLKVPAVLPRVRMDHVAMARAVSNLLDNASKYSGSSRRIDLAAREEGNQVLIVVQDYGIGINADDLPRVFDRFYRAGDPLTRAVKGTGLGLALVRLIVEAHGGSVVACSVPGEGSTFTVRLPAESPVRKRPWGLWKES